MTKKKVSAPAKVERQRYNPEFKQQALLRVVKDGVPVAAHDLEQAQFYAWRTKAQQRGQDAEVLQPQQSETARLKLELARLEEENAFLKKRRRTSRSNRSEVRHDEGVRKGVLRAGDVPGAIGVGQRLLRMAQAGALEASVRTCRTGRACEG